MTFRHDILVETKAELLREAKCRNVHRTCSITNTTSEKLRPKGTITADGSRLDKVAIGLYGKSERTFMDVCIRQSPFHAIPTGRFRLL